MVDRKDKWAATLERIASSASWSGGQRFAAEPEGRFRVSGEDRKKYKSSQRHSLLVMFIFACIGIFIGVIENEVRYHALENLWDVDLYITIMKSVLLGTSVISIIFLCRYYSARVALKRGCGIYLPPGLSVASLQGAGLWRPFLLDLLILLPQPLLGLDVSVLVWNKGLGRNSVYHIDSILLSLMFLRIYFLPRVYGECLSEFASDAAYALERFNRVTLDQTFIVKHVIAYSLDNIVYVFFIEVAIFAYLMMVFERPTDGGALQYYANCVWLTVITMTTVGYGDLYPTTFLGRVVSIMASITAVIMLAVTINLVISKLSLTRPEEKVIEVMDRISLRKSLKLQAVIVIQRWLRAYNKYMKEGRKRMVQAKGGYICITELKSDEQRNQDLRLATLGDQLLLEAVNDFSEISSEHYSKTHSADVPELVGNLQSKMVRQNTKIRHIVADATLVHDYVTALCKQGGISLD